MSALEEVRTDGPGKDTGDGTQPSAGGVHPALPHLPYRSAVRAALYEADLPPDVVDAGVRTEQPGDAGELFVTVSWLPGHPLLSDPAGLDLLWSHLTGWSARADGTVRMLPVDGLAAPAVIAWAALHLLTDGLDTTWKPADDHPRWEHAAALDTALEVFAAQEVTW